jgi:IS30 family transposase
MGQCFDQFGLEARCEIAERRKAGQSLRQIAAALDCSPSSVSRELNRNQSARDYKPAFAEQQARARRWSGSRLLRNPKLQKKVLRLLRQGLSPEQVAGKLRRKDGRVAISHESIYRFVHSQIARTKNYDWRQYLPQAKSKRGRRARRRGGSVSFLQGRVAIHERSKAANDRLEAGHWEADLMLFRRSGPTILALHERLSRFTVIVPQKGKAAAPIAASIRRILAPLPPRLRRSVTFDNGTEFALHHTLRKPLRMKTYFCDPYAPWQKGGVENAIGRLRRGLPSKTNLAELSKATLKRVARLYNHTPRKCLGYQTPAEVFAQVLHFKCESSFPPSRE